MTKRKTREELEQEIQDLRDEIEALEAGEQMDRMMDEKLRYVRRGMAIASGAVLACQVASVVFGFQSPFGEQFSFVFLGVGVLALLMFAISLAMMLGGRPTMDVELSAARLKLKAAMDESGTTDGPG